MPYQPDSDNELSPQAREILKVIQDDMPVLRAVDGMVRSRPVLGGLHHVYARVA